MSICGKSKVCVKSPKVAEFSLQTLSPLWLFRWVYSRSCSRTWPLVSRESSSGISAECQGFKEVFNGTFKFWQSWNFTVLSTAFFPQHRSTFQQLFSQFHSSCYLVNLRWSCSVYVQPVHALDTPVQTSGGPFLCSFLLSNALSSDFCLLYFALTPTLFARSGNVPRQLGSDRAHCEFFLSIFCCLKVIIAYILSIFIVIYSKKGQSRAPLIPA